MTKAQAAARDKAAKTWKERKLWYRIGSVFKRCASCGSFDVFRSYCPADVHWTYRCTFCGAVDHAAWENAWDIGKDAIVGVRGPINQKKRGIREGLSPKPERAPRESGRFTELDGIQAQIDQIKAMLAKMS